MTEFADTIREAFIESDELDRTDNVVDALNNIASAINRLAEAVEGHDG